LNDKKLTVLAILNCVEQISSKLGGFYVIKMNLVQNCAVDTHNKISVEIRISADIQTLNNGR